MLNKHKNEKIYSFTIVCVYDDARKKHFDDKYDIVQSYHAWT